MTDKHKDEIVNSQSTVRIKASTPEQIEQKKREIEERIDRQFARKRQQEVFERDKTQTLQSTSIPGAAVLGQLSAEEINAMKVNDQAALIRFAAQRRAEIAKRVRDRRRQ